MCIAIPILEIVQILVVRLVFNEKSLDSTQNNIFDIGYLSTWLQYTHIFIDNFFDEADGQTIER